MGLISVSPDSRSQVMVDRCRRRQLATARSYQRTEAPVEFWKPGKSDELRPGRVGLRSRMEPSSNAVKDGPQEVLPASEPLPFT